MQEQHAFPFLRETLLFLGMAGLLIPVLQRLRINPVLGFLAAGALVGPFGLGLWADRLPMLHYLTIMEVEGVALLGKLGVLFLMFMIGLELSAERLWSLRRWVFGAGSAQVLASALIIGGIALAFGNDAEAALVLGLMLSLSSTAVVMQLLSENRSLASPLGQAGFSILMFQDLAVVPVFILIDVLASSRGSGLFLPAGLALAKSCAAIAIIYLLGRRVIRPMFRFFSRQPRPDVFMALTLLSTLGIAALTAATGLSMALGALLAGLLLAETEFRHEVEVTIEPFKGLLMGLFFMSVGMQIDVREIARNPFWIPAAVLGLFCIKAFVLAPVFRIGGLNWGRAGEGGLLLGQGGEFAFIIAGYALAAGLFDPALGRFVMLVVGLSMFATPTMAKVGELFRRRWEKRHEPVPNPADAPEAAPASGRIVIAGFGRVGQLLGQILDGQGIEFVALERDANLVSRLHAQGFPVYYGDASRGHTLDKIHIGDASAIVLTMDHPASALHAVRAIRRRYPLMPLFARSRDEKHANELKKAGATTVIPETLEAGLQLSAFVLHALGNSRESTNHLIQIEREQRIAAIREGTSQ